MDAIIQILSIVLTAVTTVIVACIQVKSSKKEKHDKETAKLQAELDKQKEDARLAAQARQEKKLERVANSVDKMETEISEIKQDQSEIKHQLDRVAKITHHNLDYTTEINNALTVLSNTMIDQTADENLRKSMQVHHDKTMELQKKLYETTF